MGAIVAQAFKAEAVSYTSEEITAIVVIKASLLRG